MANPPRAQGAGNVLRLAVASGIAATVVIWGWWWSGPDPAEFANQPRLAESSASLVAIEPRLDAAPVRSVVAMREFEPPPCVDLDACNRDLDLFGVVVDPEEKPVAGALVRTLSFPWLRTVHVTPFDGDDLREQESRVGPSTFTASDGTFALRLRRGELVEAYASAAGFATAHLEECQAGERLRFQLEPAADLTVQVLRRDGSPAIAVPVACSQPGPDAERSRITDERGRATFTNLESGPARLSCGDAGKGCVHEDVGVFPGACAILELARADSGGLRGRVTDAATTRPIAGAVVQGSDRCSATTDGEGRYRLNCSRQRTIAVATADGYRPSRESSQESGVLHFALERADRARGRVVTARGSAAAGAYVAAFANATEHDLDATVAGSDGRFVLAHLARGIPHTLVVQAPGCPRYLLDFEPGRECPDASGVLPPIDLGDVVLPPARAIEGVALDDQGSPLKYTSITLSGCNGDRSRLRPPDRNEPLDTGDEWIVEKRSTDDLGRFRFPDLAPGEYSLCLAPEQRPEFTQTVALPYDRDVRDVVFRVAGRELVVCVRDGSGRPAVDVRVDLWSTPTLAGWTDGQGRAVFHALGDELFRVQASADGCLGSQAMVWPAARTIELVLREPAAIAGTVVDDAGVPLVGEVTVRGDGFLERRPIDSEGRFRVDAPCGLPVDVFADADRPDVHAARSEDEPTAFRAVARRVLAPAEDLRLIALPPRSDAHLDLRVVDPDGRPVASAHVFASGLHGPAATAWTDRRGCARIERLDAAPFRIRVLPPSFAELAWVEPSETWVDAGEACVTTLQFRRGERLAIEVRDPSGRPLPDAEIELCTAFGVHDFELRSGPDGRVETAVLAGERYRIRARFEGEAECWESPSQSAAGPAELILRCER